MPQFVTFTVFVNFVILGKNEVNVRNRIRFHSSSQHVQLNVSSYTIKVARSN